MATYGRGSGGRIGTDQKRALAHPVRLHIWSMFTDDSDRPLTAEALHADLTEERQFRDITLSQVNYHLARLRDARLLPAE